MRAADDSTREGRVSHGASWLSSGGGIRGASPWGPPVSTHSRKGDSVQPSGGLRAQPAEAGPAACILVRGSTWSPVLGSGLGPVRASGAGERTPADGACR